MGFAPQQKPGVWDVWAKASGMLLSAWLAVVTLPWSAAAVARRALPRAPPAASAAAPATASSALFDAIAADDIAKVEAAVKSGLHLAARNADGEPPLYAAADKGSARVLA